MSFREHHSRWEFDLKSSPDSLWPFVADTNRFNRDTGVPKLEIQSGHKRLPNARRKVRFSIYGLPVEWEEQPFEWVKPMRFGVERVYSKGPMACLKVLGELTPKDRRWHAPDLRNTRHTAKHHWPGSHSFADQFRDGTKAAGGDREVRSSLPRLELRSKPRATVRLNRRSIC